MPVGFPADRYGMSRPRTGTKKGEGLPISFDSANDSIFRSSGASRIAGEGLSVREVGMGIVIPSVVCRVAIGP